MIDYESAFLNNPCPQAIFDTEFNLLSCNDSFAHYLGHPLEILFERAFKDFFIESEWLILKSEIEKLQSNTLESHTKLSLHTSTAKQEVKRMDWNISIDPVHQRVYTYLIYTPPSAQPEQRRNNPVGFSDSRNAEMTEELLKKQNEQIRKTLVNLINTQKMIRGIAEAVPAALTAYNIKEQKYIFNNKKLATMLGYTKKEFEKLFKDPILENIHPTQKLKAIGFRKKILSKSRVLTDVMLKHKDGSYRWFSVHVVKLQDYQDKAYAAVTMLLDIHERVSYENQLKAANLSLQENQLNLEETLSELSDRNFELDQLVYKISHDLRSPLSSILGLVNIYKIETELTQKDHYVDLIENRIHKLDGFVKEMLNYAKTSRSDINLEEIDFEALIQECLDDLEYMDSAAKIAVKTTIQPDQYQFKSDKLRLRIILNNIISNAFKYYNPMADEPSLKINIHIKEGKVFIHIEDNGIGIQEEYLNKIFDMFFRATNKSDGAGLGMYIVKQTIEQLRGNIVVASYVGQGTTFKIQLPNLMTP